jgi:hypothetical protein
VALASLLGSPFAFGAANLTVWGPLTWLWIGLGACALSVTRGTEDRSRVDRFRPMPRLMIALHLLFAVQLLPLPPSVLRVLSPGSFAAHFLPPADSPTWAPLTASPTGTVQAWFFILGLQGLALALFSGDASSRDKRVRWLFLGMVGVGAVLALEGLVQSKSAHPYWLYGVWPVPGAGGHEMGIFGPYYNRDHYANLLAIAASVASGLLAASAWSASSAFSSLVKSADFGIRIGLVVALLLMVVANAAAGSRGGLVALAVGLCVGAGPFLLARPRLALGSAVLLVVALFGTGIPAAFTRMADVDFEASRLLVWRDAMRLTEFFPVFGCGLGAFAPAYWPYQRVVRYEYWPHLHNEYGQWVLEGGIVGLALAAYFLRRAWIAAPRVFGQAENRPALAGLAAALTHAAVDCAFRIPANAAWTAVLLVCLAGGAARPPRASGA